MPTGDPADPRRLILHVHQRLIGIMLAINPPHAVKIERLAQDHVRGDGQPTKMRRHMRHELHRMIQLATDFALVHVSSEAVGHQVVAQQLDVVLVRRRGAGAGIAGHAKALRRAIQPFAHRHQQQLHGSGVAAGIADPTLAVVAAARQFRQAVVPAIVEAKIGGQIDDHWISARRIEGVDANTGLAIRQRQHDGFRSQRRQLGMVRRAVAQLANWRIDMIGHALPFQLARGHVGQLEIRMRCQQPDQLAAHVAARADDPHTHPSLAAHRSPPRRMSSPRRTAGHSLSSIENTTVSRTMPSARIM